MTEGTTVFVFPGQGSQMVGMGSRLRDRSALVRQTFEEAEEAFGGGLLERMHSGPIEALTETEYAQPAILTVSTAYARILAEDGVEPDFVLGHSLGEYSALVAADALDFADAVRLTRLRGRAMQQAVPLGVGTMTALIGARDAEQVYNLCRACAQDEVLEPAGFNCPGQVVLAGHVGAIERAEQRAKEFGCGVAKRLQVSAPFHCSLLDPAGAELGKALASIKFRTPKIPYVANVDAELVRDSGSIAGRLVAQVSKPVLFEQSLMALEPLGIERWIEVGAGATMSGLVKRTLRKAVVSFEDGPWATN